MKNTLSLRLLTAAASLYGQSKSGLCPLATRKPSSRPPAPLATRSRSSPAPGTRLPIGNCWSSAWSRPAPTFPRIRSPRSPTTSPRVFPKATFPRPSSFPARVKVSFKEWTVPTIGSRPHDPLATRDGYLWYTGQYANVLGRVDTKTGKIQEFRPPTPGSGPHGLVEDKDGNIWFTANSKGYIGKLDPEDREVHRIQAARRRERSAHASVRPERHSVVHRAELAEGWPAQSRHRRDQGGRFAHQALESLRHGDRFQGHSLLL